MFMPGVIRLCSLCSMCAYISPYRICKGASYTCCSHHLSRQMTIMSARRSERLCFYLQMSPVPGINPYSARWRSWPATAPSPEAASGAAPWRRRGRCALSLRPNPWRPCRPMGAWLVSQVRTRGVPKYSFIDESLFKIRPIPH